MKWREQTFVAFDTETTGQYPLQAEICEIAAVKWRGGQIIDEYQTLLKPSKPMDDFVISIHKITNEMVAQAPLLADKIGSFHEFLGDAVAVAHHAPFDLGFISIEFEKAGLPLPSAPVICSSLLARAVIESPNHRLQTLVQLLQLPQGQAHRALDDAKACLGVALFAMNQLGADAEIEDVFSKQGKALYWREYSLERFKAEKIGAAIVEAILKDTHLEIVYKGGSQAGKPRQVKPVGLVRNAQGDYIVARDFDSPQNKRFYLDKIASADVIY